MKIYLRSIVKQLKNYSESLDKKSIFIDKPWALIDEEFEMQKLIFKRNKELILSKNGQVQIGKWDYFPEAKSLLIDRNQDKILCNEAFIDKGVMILRLDGTKNRFFILANENVVPDLDADRYLKQLRYQKLKILEKELKNGKILEVQREYIRQPAQIGNPVTMEAEPAEDGRYKLARKNRYLEIKKGRIFKLLTEKKYINPDGQKIKIQHQDSRKFQTGDYVFIHGEQVENAIINFSKSKNLIVRDGILIRLESKNKVIRWISKEWKKFWYLYED